MLTGDREARDRPTGNRMPATASNWVMKAAVHRLCSVLLIALSAAAGGAAAISATTSRSAGSIDSARELSDRCRELLTQWTARFDAEHLAYVIAEPYVIAGDTDRRQLEAYRDDTILAATRALQAEFFKARPDRPILILLFETDATYRRLSRAWFGDTNVSPYGYCRDGSILVMNIRTGTGTLVHELTHALIRPDFPGVPDWFNEGLASLFEQCTIADQQIRGHVNWRLGGLQDAIRHGAAVRRLRDLIEDRQFYDADRRGLNYAQARYLLMYLQEKNLLETYYHRFRDHAGDDPTGLRTLEAVIAPQKLDEFEQQWQQWVMGLRFER